MKQFKNIFIFGVIVLFLVGVMIIQYATPSRTVDFRGEILSIAVSEEGIITISAASDISGHFIFRIDDKSKLEDYCGEKITLEDLTEGAMVDINYCKYIFKQEDIYTVKSLRLYKINIGPSSVNLATPTQRQPLEHHAKQVRN